MMLFNEVTDFDTAQQVLLAGATVMVAKGSDLAKRLTRELGAMVLAEAFTTAVSGNPSDGNKAMAIMGLVVATGAA